MRGSFFAFAMKTPFKSFVGAATALPAHSNAPLQWWKPFGALSFSSLSKILADPTNTERGNHSQYRIPPRKWMMRILLLLHALLLLLASTDFTIVTAALGQDSWRWSYLRYSSQSGWGYEYVSDYSLPVVLTYIAAFAAGLAGFAVACRRGRWLIGMLGVVLSALGLVSFGIEGSHWFVDHNRSWLAFSPALMFVLVVLAWLPRRPGGQEGSCEPMAVAR